MRGTAPELKPKMKSTSYRTNDKKKEIGLFFGQKETGAERVAMATALRVSFCFFCDGQLWCQVSKTLL